MADILNLRPAKDCIWDCVSFGEVMLRFDPGFGRVRNSRQFTVWEGGGEYNVARAMRKCWASAPRWSPRCRSTIWAGWWKTLSCRAAWTCATSSGASMTASAATPGSG